MAHRVARSRWDASLPRSATRRRPMPPKAARGPMTATLALALVLLVLVPAPLAAQDVPAGAPAGSSSDDPMCDLYIAPSSTSEEGGPPKMGIYAGRTFAASERVGPADIAVQLLDVDGHTGRNLPDYAAPQLGEGDGATALNPFGAAAAMMWTSDSVGGAYDSSEAMGGGGQTFAAIPGVGMLANYHSAAVNANWNENGTLLRTLMEDQAGGMGVAHPGRGAVSEYYNVTVVATQASESKECAALELHVCAWLSMQEPRSSRAGARLLVRAREPLACPIYVAYACCAARAVASDCVHPPPPPPPAIPHRPSPPLPSPQCFAPP